MAPLYRLRITLKFMKPLGWVAIFVATTANAGLIARCLTLGFISKNRDDLLRHDWTCILGLSIIFVIFSFVIISLVFSITQIIQSQIAFYILKYLGTNGLYGFYAIIPATTLINFFVYNHTLSWHDPAELTSGNYFIALRVQTPISLFSLLYFRLDIGKHKFALRGLIWTLIVISALAGAGGGYEMVQQ